MYNRYIKEEGRKIDRGIIVFETLSIFIFLNYW